MFKLWIISARMCVNLEDQYDKIWKQFTSLIKNILCVFLMVGEGNNILRILCFFRLVTFLTYFLRICQQILFSLRIKSIIVYWFCMSSHTKCQYWLMIRNKVQCFQLVKYWLCRKEMCRIYLLQTPNFSGLFQCLWYVGVILS